jgi:hypothetical protein
VRSSLCGVLAAAFATSVAIGSSGESGAPSPVSSERLRAHVRFLADDLLEGRETGSRGFEIAALYVATAFESMGLRPALPGGFLQPVPLRRATLVPLRSAFVLSAGGDRRRMELGRDAWLLPSLSETELDASGPVVFAGYGVSAPRRRHDDYAGVDVKGKVVAVLSGAPETLPADERAYYGSAQVKEEEAVRRGSVGILYLTLGDEAGQAASGTPRRAPRDPMDWLDPQGRPGREAGRPRIRSRLGVEGTRTLFRMASRSLDEALEGRPQGRGRSFDLGVKALFHVESRPSEVSSSNVLAVLPGSDPSRDHEYVVVTAHLDHLGIGPPRDGDSVYNGAYDNATGSAGLVEIARSLASLPRAPARPVLFAALTGEEEGLLGAEYLARNPPPSGELVADLNIDMFLTLFPLRGVAAVGADHSTLGSVAREAAAQEDLELTADPLPEEVLFIRSDHYAFARRGIPSLMLACGVPSADPAVDGARMLRDWLKTAYHTPKDDVGQAIDYAAAARIADVYARMVVALADAPSRPSWLPGDFFGEAFSARSRADP